MAVYFITGKLGKGKTLGSVNRIEMAIRQGRRIATNLDLFPEKIFPPKTKDVDITRIPDKPRVEDLEALGTGDYLPVEEYNSKKFGLLVLDELGTWINSRSWNDKSRAPVIDWFLHARKLHWDIIFIVQSIESIDKQLKDSLCEFHAPMKNFGNYAIPVLSPLWKLFTASDYPLTFPQIHQTRVIDYQDGVKADSWWFFGKRLYPFYHTGQIFEDGHKMMGVERVDMRASYCLLSPYHLKGRYIQPTDYKKLFSNPVAIYAVTFVTILIINAISLSFNSSVLSAQPELTAQVAQENNIDPLMDLSHIDPIEINSIAEDFGKVTIMGSFGKKYILKSQKLGHLVPSQVRQEGITTYYRTPCDADIYYQGEKLRVRCSPLKDPVLEKRKVSTGVQLASEMMPSF